MLKAKDLKVGDRYKIEYEVAQVVTPDRGRAYVRSRMIVDDKADDRPVSTISHSDGDSLDFAVNHVRPRPPMQAGQVYEGPATKTRFKIVHVHKDGRVSYVTVGEDTIIGPYTAACFDGCDLVKTP
jgi:hypothetical protein